MFMQDDEHILLMSYNKDIKFFSYEIHVMPYEDRKRLADVGVKTSIEYPQWSQVEPERGKYNFSRIEEILDMNRKAGIKTIFSGYNYSFPRWIPDDWYAKFRGNISLHEVISIWNEEAQAYIDGYYKMLVDKYASDDVMFVLSEYLTGESYLHNTPCFYDAAAIADHNRSYGKDPDMASNETVAWLLNSLLKHMVRRQEILRHPHNEVWDSAQWLIAQQSKANGNYAQTEILHQYRELWPGINIVLLQYTYFAHGQPNFDHVETLRELSGCHVIVEAQYCEGLSYTTPEAKKRGMRAQIVCPLHPFTGHKKLEQWMIDAMKKSLEEWKNESNDSQ